MMKYGLRSITFNFGIFAALVAAFPVFALADALEGITAPNADITLSFVVPGRISDVLVEEGHIVQKDQLLVRLFDEPERIRSRQLMMLCQDRTKILAAEAELAQKVVDLKKVRQAKAKGAASDWEVEHLKLGVRIAELSLKSAILEQEQYRQRYEHARSQLEQMCLLAPIAGRVEEVSVEVGESVGSLGPVIRIVQNDPLWIDVPIPLHQVAELAVGHNAWIIFPDTEMDSAPNGRIISISAVADAASDTLRVRIEVPNPGKRPAGERVFVRFIAHTETKEVGQLHLE